MSIEQRVKDAFEDFHSLIAGGWEADRAISEAARTNGLKAEVLETRLSKRTSIDALVDQIRHNAAGHRVRVIIHEAVARYIGEGLLWINRRPEVRATMLDRVASALGRLPTSEETSQADSSYEQIREERSIQFQREQIQFLRELQIVP